MSIRCPMLTEEFVGSDVACVCRKHIARQRGIECPRQIDRYEKIKKSCFDIGRLVRPSKEEIAATGHSHYTAAKAREVLLPDKMVAGTGAVTKETSKVPSKEASS